MSYPAQGNEPRGYGDPPRDGRVQPQPGYGQQPGYTQQPTQPQQPGYTAADSAPSRADAQRPGAGLTSYERTQDERSIGEMISDLTQKFSTLLQQEVALAKAEASQEAKKAGKGAGMLGGAGLAAHFALLFLSLGLWWAIAILIGDHDHPALGWSGLIMMIIWGIIAGVLAMLGRTELKRVRGLPHTTDSVAKIPNAVKGNEEKNR